MNELRAVGDFPVAGESLAQPVFDGLDVVIGTGFYGFDGFAVGDREIGYDFVELCDGFRRKRLDPGEPFGRCERFEPLDLDEYAVADQAIFAEVSGKASHLFPIAAVKRGQGGEGNGFSHPSI